MTPTGPPLQEVQSPPPEEIRRQCREIRCGWSEAETLKRAGINGSRPWVAPESRVHWDGFDDSLIGVGTFWND